MSATHETALPSDGPGKNLPPESSANGRDQRFAPQTLALPDFNERNARTERRPQAVT
jgi:hypothetical protein